MTAKLDQSPRRGAIARVWSTRDATDHGARTYPALLKKGGAFAIDLAGLTPDLKKAK
jgi:hypothetical protein